MMAQVVTRGRGTVTVLVDEIRPDDRDGAIVLVAQRVAGIDGTDWRIARNDDARHNAVVTLDLP